MRFFPDYTLNIIKEKEFPSQIKQIETELASCRSSGYFSSFDDKQIYYEYFLAENSKASIVIVHGLSEFTKKFYELAWYFLNQGYNVFLYDQRGHGLSCRQTDRVDLIHIDSFDDYKNDLGEFIEQIVIKAESKPVYIFSHSMGGAVCAMYLAEHCDRVEKAVMSAPLIEPVVGKVPMMIAKAGLKLDMVKRGNTAKFRYSKDFNPDYPHHISSDASYTRFEHNMQMRIANVNYQSTPMTVGWVYNSLILKSKLLSSKVVKCINTPILMLCAEKDTVVKRPAQLKFAKKCNTCQLEIIENAKHSMFSGKYDTVVEYVNKILDFYKD